MSNQIVGTGTIKQPVIVGTAATLESVPVTINSYRNRRTKQSTIKVYLKNGFDNRLWSPPLVARLPNGDMHLFDGDHRRAMWKIAHPNDTHMDAYVVDIKDYKEISQLFVKVNKTGRKSLTSEEIYLHEVWGGIQSAVNTESNLIDCKLSVSLLTGEPNDSAGSSTGFVSATPVFVKIDAFKNAIKANLLDNTKKASELIQTTWKYEKSMSGELLHGFAYVCRHFPEILDPKKRKIYTVWNKWLANQPLLNTKSTGFISQMKVVGGNHHNKEEFCVALGIIKSFKKWAEDNGHLSSSAFTKHGTPSKIEVLEKKILGSKASQEST
jgi:hypothetical protein